MASWGSGEFEILAALIFAMIYNIKAIKARTVADRKDRKISPILKLGGPRLPAQRSRVIAYSEHKAKYWIGSEVHN
jgi:hypothetical protein